MTIDSADQIYVLDASEGPDGWPQCNKLKRIDTQRSVTTVYAFQNGEASSMVQDKKGDFYYFSGRYIKKLSSGVETNYCGGAEFSEPFSVTGACSKVYFWAPSGFGMDFSRQVMVFSQA